MYNFLSMPERYEMNNIKYWKKENLIELYFFFLNEPFQRNDVTKTITFQ